MTKNFFTFVIISFLLLSGLSSFADSSYNFDGFISDNAKVLNIQAKDSINALLWDLQKKTGTDIAVVTVKSLDGRSIEETALDIGRKFKLGEKGKDTGAVVLVAPYDKKMRIEIGYGLEGTITDGHAGRIRDEQMLPYFRNGDYQSGIWRGTYTLAQDIAQADGVTLSDSGAVPKAPSDGDDWGFLLLFFIIFLSIRFGFFPIFIPFGGGGYRGGGFGGGGSFGGFGGGGASGGW